MQDINQFNQLMLERIKDQTFFSLTNGRKHVRGNMKYREKLLIAHGKLMQFYLKGGVI